MSFQEKLNSFRYLFGEKYRYRIYKSMESFDYKFHYVDIGAIGGVSLPWSQLKERVETVSVEPNPTDDLNYNHPIGLGDCNKIAKLYITEDSKCSSVYQPNKEILQFFNSENTSGKSVINEIDIQLLRGDEVLDGIETIDFLKVDTQGSEYSIIDGLSRVLNKHKPIVYLECWMIEVYKGAHTFEKILDLMGSLDYETLWVEQGAVWKRTRNIKKGRGQVVGLDVLFISKKVIDSHIQSDRKTVVLCHLLELYGFFSHIERILNMNDSKSEVILNYESGFKNRIKKLPINPIVTILDYLFGFFANKYKFFPKLYD